MKFLLSILLLLPLSIKAQKDSIFWKNNAMVRAGELEITFKMRDYRYYASLNHPKLVEMMGGIDAFTKTIEEQMTQIEREMKIDSIDFGEPFGFMKCDSVINCILPQTTFLRLNDTMALRATNYLLGTSDDDGNTWFFVDGTIEVAYLDIILPKRCTLLAIPKREEEFLTIKK